MRSPLTDASLDQLFREARSHSGWLDKPLTDETLRQLYDLMKWGPTSVNSSPARFVFIRSQAGKQRLLPALAAGNVEKTMTAPVTVIVAYDLKFYDKLPQLFPHAPKMREVFVNNPEMVEATAVRNSSLQGAYLMMAARSLGLDCGPMSGFDNARLDEEFFAVKRDSRTPGNQLFPEGHIKSNFLCNLGYGDAEKAFPRGPRLSLGEACTLL